jgi:hypothetical protein
MTREPSLDLVDMARAGDEGAVHVARSEYFEKEE